MSIVHVHHRGDRGVDGILRLIELAGHDGPVEGMLTAMCVEIAAIAGTEIASIYVREHDRLVMRGNHGFPASAIGVTALAVGEGITGLVAECMRPVSAERAASETAYKHVPGLGEEHYPVFAGVPLIAGGSAIGVLVLQRRQRAFSSGEVTLATALGAPITLAIERHRATAIRSARLAGSPRSGGVVLGRAALVPTATALSGVRVDLDRAFARLRDDLGRAMRRLELRSRPAILAVAGSQPEHAGDPTGDSAPRPAGEAGMAPAPRRVAALGDPVAGAALDRFALALCDARLRERLAASIDRPSGLRAVANEYARAPYRLGAAGDAASDAAARAEDIEELCALLGDSRALRPGAIWIADRIAAPVAIIAAARGAAALVASDALTPAAIAIARAAQLPAISDVAGLFGWVRPGDLLAVDGDTGAVLVHPAPTDIERLRRSR